MIGSGSQELVDQKLKGNDETFAAIVMAQTAEIASLDQAKEAIKNARTLCRSGGVFIVREATARNTQAHSFDDLIDAAKVYFGSPDDSPPGAQARRGVQRPGRLAIFTAT